MKVRKGSPHITFLCLPVIRWCYMFDHVSHLFNIEATSEIIAIQMTEQVHSCSVILFNFTVFVYIFLGSNQRRSLCIG